MSANDLITDTRMLPRSVVENVKRIAKAEGRTIQVQFARFLEQGVRDYDNSKHLSAKGSE